MTQCVSHVCVMCITDKYTARDILCNLGLDDDGQKKLSDVFISRSELLDKSALMTNQKMLTHQIQALHTCKKIQIDSVSN